MNLNKKYSKAAKRTVAVATAASITLGSMSQAATLETSIDTKGSLAGVLAITAEINKDLANDTESSTALAGVLAATASLHEDMANSELSVPVVAETSVGEADSSNVVAEESAEYLFADVKEHLNIRTAPDKTAELAGWLLPNRVATILSASEGWYEIQSGEVRGFVSSEFSIVGDEALALYEELSAPYVTCTVKDLNVRASSSKDSEIIGHLKKGDKALIDTDLFDVTFEDEENSFIAISYNDTVGFVSRDYVNVYNGEIPTAMNMDEVNAYKAEVAKAKEAARIAAEKKAQENASKQTSQKPATIQNEAINTGADDVTLLAALLMCEAGSSYDGMLAVGGVVMNRLRAGYASTIQGVIFQRGQFTPASSGKLARVISNGPSQAAIQAATEAINGVDITGGCKSFRSARSGHAGVNIGGNVFF